MHIKTFPAQFETLDDIRDFVGQAARQVGFREKEIYNIQLAVDEAASNIIEHAYEAVADGVIEVFTRIEPCALTIVLRDWGHAFAPEDINEPDPNAALEERTIGGLGLFFIHKLMDEVHFDFSPDGSNTLTLVKHCSAAPPAAQAQPNKSAWGDLFGLGERILGATTFEEQRATILEVAARIFPHTQIELWLDDETFRLPDWVEKPAPLAPALESMRQALHSPELVQASEAGEPVLAIRLWYEQSSLGVIAIRRAPGTSFRRRERDLLEGLSHVASVALIAWHRVSVERWRISQLNLVRTVSAQIANQSDLDELSLKVVRLIQNTFRFYYVAIFTRDAKTAALHFRASAGGATRRKGRATAPTLQVELGQGLIGHAAETGEELIANDIRQEPRYRHFESLPETRSEIALPLKVESRVLGVLDVQSDKPGAFHPYDLLVLRALADTIAVAVEGANLYGVLHRRAEQLKAVAEVSRQITSFLNLRELMQEVARIIRHRFDYSYVHLFTVHPNRRQIHYEAGSGVRSGALEGYMLSLDDPDGLVPYVARTGEMLLVNDVSKEPRYRPSPLPPANTLSELTMPLIFNEQVYGVMDIQSDQLNAFEEEDRLLFETLSDTIAAAIRNADLYRSEQWRRQVADSLREVAVLLSANASLEQVLDTTLTELERNLPADISAIWLLDSDDIYCAAVHGASAEGLNATRYDSVDVRTALARALLARQPIIRKPGEPVGPSGLIGGFDDDYSSIAAPLRIGEQAVGVLTLAHHTPGRYGHEAHAMTTTFASYAAVAIENARLYDSAQEQAYASAALLQVAQAVVSLSDLDEILGTIVRILPMLVGVERAAIYTWDEATLSFHPARAYNLPAEAASLFWRNLSADEFPMLSAAITQAEPALSAEAHLGAENWLNLQPLFGEEAEVLHYSEDRLLMSFPLSVKGEAFGVLLVEEALGGRRFRNRRIEILTGVAQQIALAIQNDLFQQETVARERLETEVQFARQIQKTFIPESLPEHDNWEISARWRTARQVGGDFYDVFDLPNGQIGLFIADIADKGIPAALFMALTRTLIRAAVLETVSPAQALHRVNELLYPDCQQGMFVTAVYGVIDQQSGQFTYANAGHNPPVWVRNDQSPATLEILSRTGMALGVIEDFEITERVIQLACGDLLVLYTDGVTEAFAPNEEMFGEERLYEILRKARHSSAFEVLDAIENEVNQFMDTLPASDDITMLAVRRHA
ncbi:MAG: GAF domain-containing protein [Anaerolineales bacterium]|jgi:serine phosphatase RsbU (regulator of sigma subunit)/putative methionine-R-sulfoxide reductase with GAF domain/anti-sigma regulatory factor (Ser/Thr protein kinase)|nr:GAF domain-containing protein [Anaerolineales bacterium]